MSMAAQDKLEEELEGYKRELETLQGGSKTSDACKEILKYVQDNEVKDPLIVRGENPFFNAPSSSGNCCVVC